ncbi:MAG: alpha-amylase family glycosyl hydrolase [Lachnospiraceae bacterium]|nr:alpha-amylase family glycosyl hydrolase [Lachnospiraceae bacterium]MDD3614605.1 alpha-amylase family glycosyl hydrolase [Lachnospiraceae bacterium]
MEKERHSYKGIIKPGNPGVLGVTRVGRHANFAVEIPDGQKASLLLYHKNQEAIEEIELPAEERTGNVAAVLLERFDWNQYDYNYEIDGEILLDPYAETILGRETFGYNRNREGALVRGGFLNSKISMETDMRPDIEYENLILYKIHPRGFTMSTDSKVRKKGTFKGIQEKIPYLKKLGINGIMLMPAYEFEEVHEAQVSDGDYTFTEENKISINYWGYTEGNYFAPKYSYSTGNNPKDEMKLLIKELHRNQIGCYMEFYFPGNTKPYLAIDALHHWMREYHVDGFRLIGDGVPVESIITDPWLTKTKLFLSYVDGNHVYQGKEPVYKNLAEYNQSYQNDFRRLLKGDEDMLREFTYRARRVPITHGVINYVTDNNGFTLYDMVSYERKHNKANGEDNQDGENYNYTWNCGAEGDSRKMGIRKLRQQQMRNALLALFLSQGTPMLYGGDEFCNSQNGNNNAYCQDNSIGWLNWSQLKQSSLMTAFVQDIAAFRKEHPILHLKKEPRIMDYQSKGYPDLSYHSQRAWFSRFDNTCRQAGLMYCGEYAVREDGTPDDFIYIAYNFHWNEHDFALPKLPEGKKWYWTIDTSLAESFRKEEKIVVEKILRIQPRSISVLVGR